MRLIKDLFADLIYFLGLKEDKEKNHLIFLVHPRDEKDIYKKIPFLSRAPRAFLSIFERFMWPVTASKISKDGELLGYMVSTPTTAKTMLKNRKLAKKKISQALKLGYRKGGKIAALGALTASLTYGGKDVYDGKIAITTGHAYTVLNINKILQRLIKDFDIDIKSLNLAIVGAAGSIGSGSARLAVKLGVENILLIDLMHKKERVENLEKELKEKYPNIKIQLSHNLADLKSSQIIIAATNHPDALIKKEHLQSGAIIIDDAQPSDVAKDVFDADDILVLEGGAVKTKGVSANFPLGLCEKDDNFSCMAEGLLLLFEKNTDKAVLGEINMEHLNYISQLARKYNFEPAKYQNYKEKCISNDKLEKVRQSQV